jgi:predicted GIY-YIG superfamily endonuclease|tara:strand:+ start:503 stop:922 length:420 start_codon:yes stop_codon:yes gene_type:complete
MNINNHKLKKLDNITNYLYFLFYKNKLVYIGQTNNINKRLVDHRRKDNSYTATNKKIFDRYYAISSISDKITKKWEKILIKKLKPKYNIGHDKDAKYKKKWIKRKWSDKKIKKFKNFYLNNINMICNSKQGYYRLVKKN